MDMIELIHLAKQGDLDAFNELVIAYQDSVYRRALWILGDEETAEDMAQEVFILAFKNLGGFRNGSFKAWLLRITTNVCYDEIRYRKRHPATRLVQHPAEGDEEDLSDRLVAPGLSVEESIEQMELRDSLQKYIRALPKELGETLYLVDILELDYAEAAAVMSVPIGTIKSRLARARRNLRGWLIGSPDLSLAGDYLPGVSFC